MIFQLKLNRNNCNIFRKKIVIFIDVSFKKKIKIIN